MPTGPARARAGGPLNGTIAVPGDKSISHRALMIGGIAVGETVIHGLLEGEDVLRTAAAMAALGAEAARGPDGVWRVYGRGVGGLVEPADILDLGNSGTSARLLMGLIATSSLTAFFTGDASLRRRPMARVRAPLEQIGARFVTREGGRMPLAIIGTAAPTPIVYRLPVASAQVKSAILLAGLNAPGKTTVIEAAPTRDHTELMLRHFGVAVDVAPTEGGTAITVTGQPEITGRTVRVPGDPSSAAFPLAAALIVPGSRVTVRGIGLNPRRTGLIETLAEMGADIAIANQRVEAGEPVGDATASASRLVGVEVPADRAPSMIDEYPILAVVAAFARGRTTMRGLAELRVKESDRLTAVARSLAACGVAVETAGDDLIVSGTGEPPPGDGAIATNLDHRIAMAFLVMGLAARKPVTVDDARPIDTSFPGFVELMRGLGARIDLPGG
ncbi:MAG: 3-phosphoshikimate 1-carboxyvinyltransferase [Rhodospirillales bacterium]|nr:3-phosphoshikimate 1-carboxyvinyltransferase [Rhodospirillales bacterium]